VVAEEEHRPLPRCFRLKSVILIWESTFEGILPDPFHFIFAVAEIRDVVGFVAG
jgi:hypothetical protein